jgi:thiol-disulfide isomerase/thioredoxin
MMRWLLCWVLVVGVASGLFAHEKKVLNKPAANHPEAACGGCEAEHSGSKAAKMVGRKVSDTAFILVADPQSPGKSGAPVKLVNLLQRDGVRGIVLDFVATKCPFSQQQLQGVVKALSQKDGKGKGVLVATVFVDGDLEAVQKALKERPLPTLVLWDKGGKVARQWHIKATPTVLVVRKNGIVAATYEGMVPPLPDMYQHFFATVLMAVAKGSSLPPQPMMGHMGGG